MATDFCGTALAMSEGALTAVGTQLGVGAPEIWTVLKVETSGCGFLPDRRPQILFERHVFHRLTQGRFDDGDISAPTPGGYGARGAHQYDRLAAAMAKDRTAALQSASWGIGQIMGFNCQASGFRDVVEMVTAMCAGEDQHLAALGSFLASTGLQVPLRDHDWKKFARGYNGPNYTVNQYDTNLAAAYAQFRVACPDMIIRAAQLYLTYLGLHPGPIDGVAGDRTMAALWQFEGQHGLPNAPAIDAAAVASIQAALPAVAMGAVVPQ